MKSFLKSVTICLAGFIVSACGASTNESPSWLLGSDDAFRSSRAKTDEWVYSATRGGYFEQATGLVWATPLTEEMSFAEAKAYCSKPHLGHDDWMLPRGDDLVALRLRVNDSTFGGSLQHFFWTDAPSQSQSQGTFSAKGETKTVLPLTGESIGFSPHARAGVVCVRQEMILGKGCGRSNVRFRSSEAGCVDRLSGKTWTTHPSERLTWPEAVSYCESVHDGGYSDWRLPSTDELADVVGDAGAHFNFMYEIRRERATVWARDIELRTSSTQVVARFFTAVLDSKAGQGWHELYTWNEAVASTHQKAAIERAFGLLLRSSDPRIQPTRLVNTKYRALCVRP